tara:strand:+ start:1243 stop:1986 length:744 start_codon:yes stop_codon:yes gene_type:complete
MKIGVLGNTKLTLKGLTLLKSLGHQIQYVFGIPNEQLSSKVNSVSLDEFCNNSSIKLYKSSDWNDIIDIDVDMIISLGDSRYVPPMIVEKFTVIGNHGAVLPSIQGGASLVWGRMLDNGVWGVSIMELDKKIDNGTILKTRTFNYESNIDMNSFCDKCDDLTVVLLGEFLQSATDVISYKSSKIDIKVSKHIDSKVGVELLQFCLDNNLNVYMPPRTSEDGEVKEAWGDDFIERFKKGNNSPYPKYF